VIVAQHQTPQSFTPAGQDHTPPLSNQQYAPHTPPQSVQAGDRARVGTARPPEGSSSISSALRPTSRYTTAPVGSSSAMAPGIPGISFGDSVTSSNIGGGPASARSEAPLSARGGYLSAAAPTVGTASAISSVMSSLRGAVAPQGSTPRWPDRPQMDAGRSQPPEVLRQPLVGERPQSSRMAPAEVDGSLCVGMAPLSARDAPTPLSARDAMLGAGQPLSAREAREDRRSAYDTLRTSSRPPRLIMQELQRVLAAQRIASRQVSPLMLRCQWLSLKFDVEVAALDRMGSIHAVRSRRTAGEPWQFKDVCNRLLAELRIA